MKRAARKLREWMLLGGAAVLGLALDGGGEPIRGAVVAALGALGATLVSRLGGTRRWPRLLRLLGRALQEYDDRLEPTLDAAEDALSALAVEGAPFGRSLAPVREGVGDLTRRALGLGRVRLGHEATLARVFLESQAAQLERAARAEHARVSAELEQIRGVLHTIGPSVRHLALLTRTEQLHTGQAPAELEERVASLREALSEELAHA